VTLRLRNVSWLTSVIRNAVVSFFSGTVIPFKILPFGLDRWIAYQPFGSLGGAPLSLWIGTAEPGAVIPVQIFWNVLIWCAAAVWFHKSRERMVSFGG
jgi:ABC-2 type transport system permease protein